MKLVVPLRGVAQGKSGIILGSLIPCALFYLLQLYFKKKRSPPFPSPSPSPSPSPPPFFQRLRELSRILRNLLRQSGEGSLSISRRASSISEVADSPHDVGFNMVAADPYDASANPDGVIQLALTDNKLSWDLVRRWIVDHMNRPFLDGSDLSNGGIMTYQPSDGLMKPKIAVAGFMDRVMRTSVAFNPSKIVLTAGATAAIEILSFCLADPGNAFLVPSPYYPGFDRDVKWRSGVQLVPVACRSTDKFNLSIAAINRVFRQTKQRGMKVRAVLISNPSNPVGNLLSRVTLSSLLKFAQENNIHVISHETFAGSIHGDDEFVSIAEIVKSVNFDRNRVHIVYGLSKYISLSGLEVGVIYSYNEHVLDTANRLTRFSPVSATTQHLLVLMLSDSQFIEDFIQTTKRRLHSIQAAFVAGLRELDIHCITGSAGFYCWADMSKLTRPFSGKGELELWKKLLHVGKVNVTPGSSCHCIEPGWFQFCFTALTGNDIPIVIERIRKVVENCKS